MVWDTGLVRNRPDRDLLRLHRRVQSVNPPMPAEEATDAVWDTWMDLQDLQAILAGLVSRGWQEVSAADQATWRGDVSAYLADPDVVDLLGDAADAARRLAAALGVLAEA